MQEIQCWIGECSPKAKERVETNIDEFGVTNILDRVYRFPFKKLHIGHCFTVEATKVDAKYLRTLAYQEYMKTKKKFCVLTHKDQSPVLIEVARIK